MPNPKHEVVESDELQREVRETAQAIAANVKTAEVVDEVDEDTGKTTRLRKALSAAAPMRVAPGEQELPLERALAISKAKQLERDIILKRNLDPNLVHYVECQQAECLGPGIWVFGPIEGKLEDKNWESSYHPRGAYWPPERLPHCQCCEARDGIKRPLRLFFETVGIIPDQVRTGISLNKRHVRSIAKAQYKELTEPQTAG